MSKAKHRVPPKPKHYRSAKPGQCKFCGDPILKKGTVNKRATWHPQCALKWTIMNSPRDARRFVFVRDRGVCRGCGTDCSPDHGNPETIARIIEQIMSPPSAATKGFQPPMKLGLWELDHVFPLSEAEKVGKPLWVWQLGNMLTLCPACHVSKTKADRIIYADTSEYRVRDTSDALACLAQLGFTLGASMPLYGRLHTGAAPGALCH